MKLILKFIMMFLCSFFTIFLYGVNVKAITKTKMPYEVMQIQAGTTGFEITGWGFIADSQHYSGSGTHSFALILEDGIQRKRIEASFTSIDQTELMRVQGVRRCGNNEYRVSSDYCYYDYKNVGFKAIIPYRELDMNRSYQVSLEFYAKQINRREQIPLYFPTAAPFVHRNQEFEYRAISALSATQLRVSYYGTFVRPLPGDKSKYYYTKNVCSYGYGNQLFFENNTKYLNIFENRRVANTTYYRLAVQEAGCERNRRVVREGRTIAPAWIPSSFVEYSGKALTIETAIRNHPPIITIHQHPIIEEKDVETFDPMRYVSAYDQEEGDLTSKIIKSGEIANKDGTYPILFTVTDKYGATDSKTMTVTVTKPANTPPILHAYDKTIFQYDPFNYLEDVTAEDREDGNLNQKITYSGHVDTSKVGGYEVLYQVRDSQNETASKRVKIQVIKNPRERIRYFSVRKPWYKEKIPLNWKSKEAILMDQLKNRYPYAESVFHS